MDRRHLIRALGLAGLAGWLARTAGADADSSASRRPRVGALRTPDGVLPDIGCWFLTESDFAPGGYREFLDMVAAHSPWKLLTTSIRAPLVEVTDDRVRGRLSEIAREARRRGIGIVMDLDVRLAREAFRKRYPTELQQMLRLREAPLGPEPVRLRVPSAELGDHYTFRTTPYIATAGRLVRVWGYRRSTGARVEQGSVRDITSDCRVIAQGPGAVEVELPGGGPDTTACCAVAFTHLTPDVFAPHLLDFQEEIIASYSDAPFAGVCKDEWGFPPCYDGCPEHNDYWYSDAYARAYAESTGGHDLVDDCLLMWIGETGREADRVAAINHYQHLGYERNGAVEADFHRVTKAVFGPRAISATHPTWWPYPDQCEVKKNGLDWWIVPRDIAQTDETTPYCCRTALARKLGSGAWVNMFYAPRIEPYVEEVWRGALGGGRVNFHPLYPVQDVLCRYRDLLQGELMRAVCRVRLLGFITSAPRRCPVAVVFGHAAAMNWAEGGNWGDTGVPIADGLAAQGFPADLIPSSEIANGSLSIAGDGAVVYGGWRYRVLVVYRPEFEPADTVQFLSRAARGDRTRVLAFGNWTRDTAGLPFAPWERLHRVSRCRSADELETAAVSYLREAGEEEQSHAELTAVGAIPPRDGHCRLTDGTYVMVRSSKGVAGDRFEERIDVDGASLDVAARGLLAVRLDRHGRVEALAAGELRRFRGGDVSIDLDPPTDLALWRAGDGSWDGVVQDLRGALPPSLRNLRARWTHLRTPAPAT